MPPLLISHLLFNKEKNIDFHVRPFRSGEESYIAEAQKRVYSEEYHWSPAFLDYAVKIALDFAARDRVPGEEMWVAEAEGRLIGCIMLCRGEEPASGQLRLFLVEKEYRSCGVGRALTDALLQAARKAGYQTLVLRTASPLTAAIRHYEKLGFRKIEEVENHSWNLNGEALYEVKMVLKLE